jgi:CBS domain-containing protein
MRLRDVLEQKSKDVRSISSQSSCAEVVAQLVRFNIGSLIVRDEPGSPVLGIITERDILRAHAKHGATLDQMPVASIMSRELVTAKPEDDIQEAMRLMTIHRIRHLPVIQDKELVGLVSIGDVVKAKHDELERENHDMRSYIQGGGSSVVAPLG